MNQRESKMLWLRDTLDQLQKSQQQLEWTDNPEMIRLLTEAMIRDLDRCREICDDLHRKTRLREAV